MLVFYAKYVTTLFFAGDRTASISDSNSQLCSNDTVTTNDTTNETDSIELPEIFQQEHDSVKSETMEIKPEIKSEIKLENFEEFESHEQVGIDFITSNDFPDQNHQPDCQSEYLKSNITIKDEQPNVGLKDFFCDLCSLQFDKKYVYDVHIKLVHPNTH